MAQLSSSQRFIVALSVGPVQDFIAASRRTRDLWFGSWLLSEVSKAVALHLGYNSLIFPAVDSDDELKPGSELTISNKILAIVDDVERVAKCEETVVSKITNLFSDVEDHIRGSLGPSADGVLRFYTAREQLRDLPEIYWAACPLIVDDYAGSRSRVESLLNARKATRTFKPVTWGAPVAKSSLDGQRETVIDESEIDSIAVQKALGLRKKERLCGVGLLKRLGARGTDDRFFSTSHVAALPLLERLKDADRKAVNEFVATLKSLNITGQDLGRVPKHLEHSIFGSLDGHILFSNRLSDLTISDPSAAALGLRKLLNTVFNGQQPQPYYAILIADGDRIGAVIDNQATEQRHRDLSRILSSFSGAARKIVEQHRGCLVYSGGDDVLAFVPLHTVLNCAEDLAASFRDLFGSHPEFVDEDGRTPTLSAGVAVYHHTEPLQDALEAARRAERAAKEFGRNALAILLSKRSGSDTVIVGSWENDRGTGAGFCERLRSLTQLHIDGAVPDGYAYELRELSIMFSNLPAMTQTAKEEAIRILGRKREQDGKPLGPAVMQSITQMIMSEGLALDDLANEMIVARDLQKAYVQAETPAERRIET